MRLLDAKEVAALLHVSTARVYELTRQGVLPSVRIGPRQIRFEEACLMRWIQRGGKLDEANLEDQPWDTEGPPDAADANFTDNRSRADGGGLRKEGSQEPPLRLDDLREFKPIRFVLKGILRSG